MQRQGTYAVLARDSIAGSARAFDNFLTKEAITLHGVLIALATAHPVFTETNHPDFRAQGFGVPNRSAKVYGFECEHLLFSCLVVCGLPLTDRRQYYTSV
jgi:hypothetical protein